MAVDARVNICEILPEEKQPFLPHTTKSQQPPKERSCKSLLFPYRLFYISEKGAIFMIILNMFYAIALFTCFQILLIRHWRLDLHIILLLIPSSFVVMLGPIIGCSDCYFGRYKILQASIYSLLAAIVLIAVNIITVSSSIWYITFVPLLLSAVCYAPCIMTFTMDQLVGASGEELSFTIYWILWAGFTCASTQSLLSCYLPSNKQFQESILFGLASLSFIIMFTMIQCCSHVLMTKPQISSPFKLVAAVLNYARKHKFPERRSAFTYWEEECPSRIDLGKEKYGGPFTMEQVEDVKTVLKLIPVLSFIMPVVGLGITKGMNNSLKEYNTNDLHFWVDFVWSLLVISHLPIYQFLVYPFLYNHIPSMLRRIGCGMFLILLSHAFISGIEMYMYVLEEGHEEETRTALTHIAYEGKEIPVGIWLILVSNLINRAGVMITSITTLEFTIAQAPCQLRGFATTVIAELLVIPVAPVIIMFHFISNHHIVYIALSVIMLALFIMFVFVSKWYKLRKRDDVIPYHMFAENEFESNYRQENDYLKNHGWMIEEKFY